MNGTLSENRQTQILPKIETPVIKNVDPPTIEKEPTVMPPIVEPIPKPTPKELPQPQSIGHKNCHYCLAYTISNLSLRFALVVLILAFSVNLLKSK